MNPINSVSDLTELGRVRLSENFFMREMLYSEVANFHGLSNVPDDPELTIEVGRKLCEDILEPLRSAFGQINIRSAYRSASVNKFCNERYVASDGKDIGYYCSDNEYSAARHIWDKRDCTGYLGATVSVVIPWYLPKFELHRDPRPLAWWIKDNIPAYSELMFFPWLCAFNIRWYEGPSDKTIFLDDGVDEEVLTNCNMGNYSENHSDLFQDFPVPREKA